MFMIGLDFGVSRTIVAGWHEETREYRPISLPLYSLFASSVIAKTQLSAVAVHDPGTCITGLPSDGPQVTPISRGVFPDSKYAGVDDHVPAIPSLIHYPASGNPLVGAQVLMHDLATAQGTVRWLRHYIAASHPSRLTMNGKSISYADTGADFLQPIISASLVVQGISCAGIVFSVPPGAGAAYESWLSQVATMSGIGRIRFIDEARAAALGYGMPVSAGEVFLHVDLGSRSITVSLLRSDTDTTPSTPDPHCRLLGRIEEDLGGMVVDEWTGKSDEALSCHSVGYNAVDTGDVPPGIPIGPDYLKGLERAVRHSLQLAFNHGYPKDRITGILVTGWGGNTLSVRDVLTAEFGQERVYWNRPLTAIALGAARFGSECIETDQIRCRYAIRFWNADLRRYEYRPVVHPGMPFPSRGPVTRFFIRATVEGQTIMGIPVYLLPGDGTPEKNPGIELVSDPTGAVTIAPCQASDPGQDAYFVNEHEPTFLIAHPPAYQGEIRFEVQLAIDSGRCLLISARDLRTGEFVKRDHPLMRLD